MQQMEELQRFRDRFVGEWELDVTIHMPDGNDLKGKGTATVREVPQGHGIQSDLRYTIGNDSYEESDLWSYDRSKGVMHMYGVGSDGSMHDHTGRWKDADTLELHWRGVQEGGDAEETITVSWESDDTVRIRSKATVQGAPGPSTDSVGRKRKI